MSAPYQTPDPAALNRRLLAADQPGEHLWVMQAAWRVADPGEPQVRLLDGETLLQLRGPGCLKCGEPYSRKLARRQCEGEIGELSF